jgi:hypothetical protein
LHRGQFLTSDEGYGQLNTIRAKVLLAVVHIWKFQESRYNDDKGLSAVADVSASEFAERLSYLEFGNNNYRSLFCMIKELLDLPDKLSGLCDNYSFAFLLGVSVWTNKKRRNRTMLRLSFNPFVSKQLFERKAFFGVRTVRFNGA